MPFSYPIVILPEELFLIKEEIPPLPVRPSEPLRPELKELKEPVTPSKPMTFSQAWGCSILAIGAFILIIYWGRNSEFVGEMFENAPGLLLLIFFATPIIAIITIYSYHKNADKEKMQYELKMKDYANEVRKFSHDKINYKNDYESAIANFEQNIYPSIILP